MNEMSRKAKQLEDAELALVNTPRDWAKYMSTDEEQSILSLLAGIHSS